MIKIYSIDEIIEATRAILADPNMHKKKLIIDHTSIGHKINNEIDVSIKVKKKKILEKSLVLKNFNMSMNTQKLHTGDNIDKPSDQSFESLKVTKEELVESISEKLVSLVYNEVLVNW